MKCCKLRPNDVLVQPTEKVSRTSGKNESRALLMLLYFDKLLFTFTVFFSLFVILYNLLFNYILESCSFLVIY